jgi:hypothetical protein
MARTPKDRPGRRQIVLVLLAMVATITATEAAAQTREGSFLGLTAVSEDTPDFWEGRTNYRVLLRPKGLVRAVMLFARFPDAETEESTQDLFNRLVPEGAAFFKRASYGEMTLTVDAHHRWVPMDEASTTGRYDCSKWDTHKTYIAEVMRKTARDVDFNTLYNALYFKGTVVEDADRRVKIEILGREGRAYRIGVTR